MDIIAYLIERELLARRNVTLPFIGTLNRERLSSRFVLDRSHLIAPHDKLVLIPDIEQQGDQFIRLIAAESHCSQSEAIETYNQWYASSTDQTGAMLTIENVCSIDLLRYSVSSTDEMFAEHLSPLGVEPIAIGRSLASRGIEPAITKPTMTEPTPLGQIPKSEILEDLPIIENVPYTPAQTITQRPENKHHSQPIRRTQRRSGGSTIAMTLSICIAAIAALYVAYYLLTQQGILNL